MALHVADAQWLRPGHVPCSEMPAMLPGTWLPNPILRPVCNELGMVEVDPSLLERKGLCPKGTGEGTLEAMGPEGAS